MRRSFFGLAVVGSFLLALSVSTTPTANAEDVKIDKELLCKSWTHSREEDQALGGKVYRPSNSKKFPPSRFREKFVFEADGSCKFLELAPTDRHRMKSAKWAISEDDPAVIEVTYTTGGNAGRPRPGRPLPGKPQPMRTVTKKYRVAELTAEIMRFE